MRSDLVSLQYLSCAVPFCSVSRKKSSDLPPPPEIIHVQLSRLSYLWYGNALVKAVSLAANQKAARMITVLTDYIALLLVFKCRALKIMVSLILISVLFVLLVQNIFLNLCLCNHTQDGEGRDFVIYWKQKVRKGSPRRLLSVKVHTFLFLQRAQTFIQ